MQWGTASALWGLVPLAAIIVFLYLLKMRRTDMTVPAVFLWPKLTADVRANAPFQRLRPSVLLFLQLLIALLLILGLANPLRRERGLRGQTTVLILDGSASMGATDVRPTRFDAARAQIAALVDGLGAGDRCALIEAGAVTRVVFPLSSDRGAMRAALSSVRRSDAPGDMGEALRLAASLAGQENGARIVVFSDGDFPPVNDFSPGRAQVAFRQIGTGGRNLSVSALDMSDAPGGGLLLFAAVRNHDTEAQTTTMTFSVDGATVDARRVLVPAGATVSQTLPVAGGARRAEVHLSTPGDILPADDAATLFLRGAGTTRVLLVGAGDLFLERALALEPAVRLDRAPALPASEAAGTSGASAYDLVVWDGVPVQSVKSPAVWAWGASGPGLPVTDAGLSVRPRVISWKRADPVLRFADLGGVLIERGRRVQAKPEGRVLAQGTDGPLVVASEEGGRRALFVGWNVLDSDFPLRPAFPIFVDNAIGWLTDADSEGGGDFNVRTGQPFVLPAVQPGTPLALLTPDGQNVPLDTSTGAATVRAADRVGVYRVRGAGADRSVAVNLLNDDEGDVRPRATLDLSGRAVAAQGRFLSLSALWRPLALLALLVLALEWGVFVRRS